MQRQKPIGSIETSGALGTCTVLKGLVIAIGLFRAVGQVVDLNLPSSRFSVPLRQSREAAWGNGQFAAAAGSTTSAVRAQRAPGRQLSRMSTQTSRFLR
jgi:hypothetical protein